MEQSCLSKWTCKNCFLKLSSLYVYWKSFVPPEAYLDICEILIKHTILRDNFFVNGSISDWNNVSEQLVKVPSLSKVSFQRSKAYVCISPK